MRYVTFTNKTKKFPRESALKYYESSEKAFVRRTTICSTLTLSVKRFHGESQVSCQSFLRCEAAGN